MHELAAKLDTTFSMVLCLSTNTVSSVRCMWTMELPNMSYNIKIFSRFQEQGGEIACGIG